MRADVGEVYKGHFEGFEGLDRGRLRKAPWRG